MINKFDRENAFLSNFFVAPFTHKGITYKTVEHAFQSIKCVRKVDKSSARNAPHPMGATIIGSAARKRKDWEEVQDKIMYKLVKKKFMQNRSLANLLLATKKEELIEGVTWHDNYWGVCSCDKCKGKGQNKLGKILMKVRNKLKEKKK